MKRVTTSMALALALFQISLPAIPADAGKVEIASPWIRAVPPVAKMGAAYLTITSATADRLLGATTPVAEKVEIHATLDSNGVMQMRQQPDVVLAPGKPAVLAPGGMHLMLVNLRMPLVAGATVPLALRFERAGEVRIDVPVLKEAPASTPHQGHR